MDTAPNFGAVSFRLVLWSRGYYCGTYCDTYWGGAPPALRLAAWPGVNTPL